jgi:hypothetical protein
VVIRPMLLALGVLGEPQPAVRAGSLGDAELAVDEEEAWTL